MSFAKIQEQFHIQNLHARYASTIDNDRLEEWPDYFTEDCHYRITTKEDFEAGLSLGIIYATTKNMLIDRVTALRDANIYEAQTYRHILSIPIIISDVGEILRVEANFLVIRIMHDGGSVLFATGRYLDEILKVGSDLYFRERVVVTDSRKFDTLLAIPL